MTTDIHTIETQFEDQDGTITVHLPDSYESDASKAYPVLYVPAGRNLNSKPIHQTVREMEEAGEIPGIIIVTSNAYYRALPANDNAESNGAAPEYLTHLREELIPYIEAEYCTSPDRWISGFSSTGIFLLYAMVEAPDLFTGYIFQSPAFDDDWIDYSQAALDRRFKLTQAQPIKVFMGLGARDRRNNRQAGFASITAMLDEVTLDNIASRVELYPGKRHEEFEQLIRDGIRHLTAENQELR